MNIRIADGADAPHLLAVYGAYMAQSVTFETAVPAVEEFRRRIETVLLTHPYLVAESDGRPIGYAYARQLQARAAYQWSAELSMYFAPDQTRRGAGTALLTPLLELLRRQGVRTAYACVTVPNPASENFLAKAGFRKVGLFPQAGYKAGAWHDVRWFARTLTAGGGEPAPLIPFPQLRRELGAKLPELLRIRP